MTGRNETTFSRYVADEFERRSEEVIRRWVDQLASRLGMRPSRVLPTRDLVDHMPELIAKIAANLRAGEEPVETQSVVTSELSRLARLRRKQGYDIEELLREFELLGRILDDLIAELVDEFPGEPDPRSVAGVAGWLHRSLQMMGTVTASIYREEELNERMAAGRLLRDFADTLLHQLKTPLGAAESAAQLLASEDMSTAAEDRRSFAELVARNLARARAVIDDVRELALAESSYTQVGRVLLLEEVLESVRAEVQPLAAEKGVTVEIREPVPPIGVDAARTEIVLLNLVGNAIKYSDPAKPERWVRVGCRDAADAEERWCSVVDNGLGISRDLQGRIFHRFFRAHPSVAEGTGLGLAIVREAIEQMGSRLELESAPGRGTTVRFLLPRPREEVQEKE